MDVERTLDVVVAYLATYAVHGVLLGTLALLVARKAAQRAPVAVERLLRAALLGGLVTAAVPFVLGFEPLCGRFSLAGRDADTRPCALSASAPTPAAAAHARDGRATEPTSIGCTERSAGPATLDGPGEFGAAGAERASDGFGLLGASDAATAPRFLGLVGAEPATERADSSESFPTSARNAAAPAAAPEVELLPLAAPTTDLGEGRRAQERVPGSGPLSFAMVLVAVWLVGVFVGIVRAASDFRALRRALRWRTELRGGRVRALLDELCGRAGMTRRVRLSIAPCTHVPLSFGLWRPEIGLPPRTLEDLDEDEQRAVLAHELAHLARRDILWLWLARALGIVFWFQPLQRLVARELERRAEFAADLWARGRIGSGAPLASALAEIAGWLVEERRSLPAAPMARERSQLVRRVELLLEHEAGREPRSWSSVAPLACAVVAAWSPAFGRDELAVEAEHGSDAEPAEEVRSVAPESEPDPSAAMEARRAGVPGALDDAVGLGIAAATNVDDSVVLETTPVAALESAVHAESVGRESAGPEPLEELDSLLAAARSPREIFEVAALALDLEVEALETELADLERELAEGDPDAAIEAELARLRERVDRLLERRGRMRELFLALTDELGAAFSTQIEVPDAVFAAPEQDTARHALFPEESR